MCGCDYWNCKEGCSCLCHVKADPMKPSLSLLCKLASIAVHADEMTSPKGHPVDKFALPSSVEDSEVQAWLKEMGPFVPVKR